MLVNYGCVIYSRVCVYGLTMFCMRFFGVFCWFLYWFGVCVGLLCLCGLWGCLNAFWRVLLLFYGFDIKIPQ